MRIYLASSLSEEHRPKMYEVLESLRSQGHDVYAPVEHKIEGAWDYSNSEWGRKVFENDINAIKASECVVALSNGRNTTAGASWEIGYAYGIGKTVIVAEMTPGPHSLMVSNGCHATVDGVSGISTYDFLKMPKVMTKSEQK